MNKGIIITAVGIVVVALGAWAWFNYMPLATPNGGQQNTDGGQTTGNVTLTITDAAANMGTITKVDMSVDRVYLHSASQGWVLVSQKAQTFSLLDLKAKSQLALLAQTDVAADTYDQVWLHITDVKVTQSGTVKTATLPSNDFKMSGVIKVNANAIATVVLDVLADQSLYITDAKAVIFAPVVKLESRSNAQASVDSDSMVTISGGTVDTSTTAGMDVNGEVKTNFTIDAEAVLQVKDGVLEIK